MSYKHEKELREKEEEKERAEREKERGRLRAVQSKMMAHFQQQQRRLERSRKDCEQYTDVCVYDLSTTTCWTCT